MNTEYLHSSSAFRNDISVTHYESCINEICRLRVRPGLVFIHVMRFQAEYFIFLSCWQPWDATRQGISSHFIGHFDFRHKPNTMVAYFAAWWFGKHLGQKRLIGYRNGLWYFWILSFLMSRDSFFQFCSTSNYIFLAKQNDKNVRFIPRKYKCLWYRWFYQ